VIHDDRHRVGQVGHNHLDLETQHAIPRALENSLAPRVGATAPRVTATIDLDHQPRRRRQKVDDVLADDHLPAKANPELAPLDSLPQPRLRQRRAEPHFARADFELRSALMGLMRHRTSERAGADAAGA
jgi:hypothetical protein